MEAESAHAIIVKSVMFVWGRLKRASQARVLKEKHLL